MSSTAEFRDLEHAIESHLPDIDALLIFKDIRLPSRPLLAAIDFVENAVLEIKGDTKENFAQKKWFAVIFRIVNRWYRERYGDSLEKIDTALATGVVLVFGMPVKLLVPLTRRRVETPGETAWLLFPSTVSSDEDVTEWLVDPPNLQKLVATETAELKRAVVKIGSELRTLRMKLMGVDPPDEIVRGLLDGVLGHIQVAAITIVRNNPDDRGGAIWNLQMSVERTLKALAQHKKKTFQETHDLFRLFDAVEDSLSNSDRGLISRLPRQNQVMQDRYGLAGVPSLLEVVDCFNSSLELVSKVSLAFSRKIEFGSEFGLLLRRPPWSG